MADVNEIIIDSDIDNNMSDESLIELSPGYFTPSKRTKKITFASAVVLVKHGYPSMT